MADLGILLKDDLALAAFEGRKTATRRPVDAKGYRWLGLGPCSDDSGGVHPARRCERRSGVLHGHLNSFNWSNFEHASIRGAGTAEVGGRVWIRECWALATGSAGDPSAAVRYRSDGDCRALSVPDVTSTHGAMLSVSDRWRPSIHMPKWASRTWGHITSVTPCDLSTVDDAEAKREGFETVGELKAALKALYPDATWFWRVEWERIETPEVPCG